MSMTMGLGMEQTVPPPFTTGSSEMSSEAMALSLLTTETPRTTDVPMQEFDWFTYPYIIIRFILGFMAFVGNVLTIVAIIKFDYLRTPANKLVVSLSLADFVMSCDPWFLLARHLLLGRDYWLEVCLVSEIIHMTCTCANLLHILAISVERYIYIAHPYLHPTLVTDRNINIAVVIMWLWTLMITPIPMALYNRLEVGMPCNFGVFAEPDLFLGLYLTLGVIEVNLTMFFYGRIGHLAWKHSRAIASQNKCNQGERNNWTAEWKVTKMMAMILGLFLATTLPAMVVYVFNSVGYPDHYIDDRIVPLFWWANCWANPLIYAWKNPEMRRAFKTLLHLKVETSWQHTPSTNTTSSTVSLNPVSKA